jgi:uncharacterized delta-60 repeat protein
LGGCIPTERCNGFIPGAGFVDDYDPSVFSLVVQADGKVLVGGYFSTLGRQPHDHIGRLNPDGTLDSGFESEANARVYSLVVQADGKILVGGSFTTLCGQPRDHIGRLNPDGTLDNGFDSGANADVYSLAVQTDGRILVGGRFSTLGGQPRRCIGRLNADGTLDNGFNPEANDIVVPLAVQGDGKILVGGFFTTLCGQPRDHIGRLNPDGTLDNGFDSGANADVYSLAVQTDGRILVGGLYITLGGQPRKYIGRLNADGTLDNEFDPAASSSVRSVAVQADGMILVGGAFDTIGGQARKHIGRVNNTIPATQSLSYDGATITWLRGGSNPEVWRATFEGSDDGLTWTPLGVGERIPGAPDGQSGGWELKAVSVSADATVRARGAVTGGYMNSSGWFVEDYLGTRVWVSRPISQTIRAGDTARFDVVAGGMGPLSYQWHKDGLVVPDESRVTGAATPTLTLRNVLRADEANYSVVVANASGSRSSLVARLTVIEPIISIQPVSQVRMPGQSATLSVKALAACRT